MALKQTMIIGALLVSFVSTNITSGQVDVPSPVFGPKSVEEADSTRPFATPGVFNYDAQVFAPLEFPNGKQKEPNTGFFFTVDRAYTSIDRGPTNSGSSSVRTGSEYIWGNRYEFGWFTDDDDGWALSYQNGEGTFFTAGIPDLVANPTFVRTRVSTVEINRIFRQNLEHGGTFEPYVGFRYFNLSDNTEETTAQLIGIIPASNTFRQNFTNDVFGFQAGGRYNRRRGRWRTTLDGALSTAYNQQRGFATDITISGLAVAVNEDNFSEQAFVPILDGQWELAYNVTRDIAIRGGVQATYAWNGIARADITTTALNGNSTFSVPGASDPGLFDDDFVAVGFIFGVEWRR